MTLTCDNEAIGVLVRDELGRWLVFQHDREPFGGVAPFSTHRDRNSSTTFRQAEQIVRGAGLTARAISLSLTAIQVLPDRCDRMPGPLGVGHNWTVFTAAVLGPGPLSDGSLGVPSWQNVEQLQTLLDLTVQYARGYVDKQHWKQMPGLDPAWAVLLSTIQISGGFPLLDISPADQAAVLEFARCHLAGSNVSYMRSAV